MDSINGRVEFDTVAQQARLCRTLRSGMIYATLQSDDVFRDKRVPAMWNSIVVANQIPRDRRFDSTRAFLSDPYGFIGERCRRFRCDVFETRLLLRRTLCLSGSDAAALFYDRERFRRAGATPEAVRATLFGRRGVQGLDGEAHRRRKQMLMSVMTPDRIHSLTELTRGQWEGAARQWTTVSRVVLYDELHILLTRAVCAWAGVAVSEEQIRERARQLSTLFDSAGALPWGNLRARSERRRTERWIASWVREIRRTSRPDTPAAIIAYHTDHRGRLLQPRVAAVEILNLLRPTVAISVFIVFMAHALHHHPEWRERVATDSQAREWFVQEVRRFYPFFPAVFARVRRDFEWHGYAFKRRRRVLLDIYGTGQDPRVWDSPEEFRPERFAPRGGSPFAFIPQGGGDYCPGHRCAGEWITLELLKASLQFLAGRLRYEVPKQDLRIDRTRLPALPRDRFVISHVQLLNE